MKLCRYRYRSGTWVKTGKARHTMKLGLYFVNVRPTPGGWFIAEVFATGLLDSVSTDVFRGLDEAKAWAETELRRFYNADNLPARVKRRQRREWPEQAGV